MAAYVRRVLLLRGRGGPGPGRRGSPVREQRRQEAAANRAGVPHPALPWRQPRGTPYLQPRGSSAARTLLSGSGSSRCGSPSVPGAGSGPSCVGWGPRSLRARPFLP